MKDERRVTKGRVTVVGRKICNFIIAQQRSTPLRPCLMFACIGEMAWAAQHGVG